PGGACLVVVVRGEGGGAAEERRLPVGGGVDGATWSEEALAFAFDAAASRGVELVAVHVWHEVAAPFGYDPFADPAAVADEELRALDGRLAEHLSRWAGKHPDVPVRRVLVRGRP